MSGKVLREIVLDTETTGLRCHDGDRLVEIGCVELINRKVTGNNFHAYINPERDMAMEAFKIHGLSSEFLRNKPIFAQVANDFLEFIQDSTLVIHNANFDIGFLNMELQEVGKETLSMDRVIDTLIIARRKFPKAPANLDALCQRYGISLESRSKHGALIDSELLAMVYVSLLEGDQATMSFTDMQGQNDELKHLTKDFVYRKQRLSRDQEERHKALLDRIPNSLWNAIKSD